MAFQLNNSCGVIRNPQDHTRGWPAVHPAANEGRGADQRGSRAALGGAAFPRADAGWFKPRLDGREGGTSRKSGRLC